ncbi:hypothetical protein [Gulosibacter molinativorax]|uniref:Tat pathway signal sequence domain protein n=1 Tax=Gulosibacter molinativorax TaxID=256821 RepID=A0ABT7C5R6_9MICO|nr:hypothetical protein [Gulosibacter molinativorax]MDJ1370519.1 hypothetical protein [Gulosibacter molinativorax]QUY62070.1 Hypotetical protein [Gulosibacter molinativorax]
MAHVAMHPRRSTRIAAAIALASGLWLSGCSADSATEAAPLSGTTISATGALPRTTYDAHPHDREHVLEVPGAAFWVNQTALTDSVPWDVGADLVESLPEDAEPTFDSIHSSAGEEFLIVQVLGAAPTTMPQEPLYFPHESRVLVDGEEVPGLHGAIALESSGGLSGTSETWLLVSVPEGSAPDSVVLEFTQDDRTQRLSLIDGTRVESDVEEYYDTVLTTSHEEVWWEYRDETLRGDLIITAGLVTGAQVTPALAPAGWAEPGYTYLGVELGHTSQVREFTHTGQITLTFQDGSQLEPIDLGGQPAGTAQESTVWFSVPLDTGSATVSIEQTGSLDGTKLDFGVTEFGITLEPRPAS